MPRILSLLTAGLCLLTACGPESPRSDEQALLSRESLLLGDGGDDGGVDAGPSDAGPSDAGTVTADAGNADAGPLDGGTADAGALDAGSPGPTLPAPLTLSSNTLDLPAQPACSEAVGKVQLRNPSALPRKLLYVSSSGGFLLKSVNDALGLACPLPCIIPAATPAGPGTLDVNVSFTPQQPGTTRGMLVLDTDDPDAPTLTASLSGKATGPLLVLSQTTVPFGTQTAGASTSRTVTVLNLGNAPFSDTPGATAPFTVPASLLTVPAGGSASLTVQFQPTTRGDFLGALSLTHTDLCPAAPTAWLTGQGVLPPKVALSHDTLSFPRQAVGTKSAAQQVTVRNDGDARLQVTGLTLTGATSFQVDPAVAFSLAAGESKPLSVTFLPTVAGPASATLQVHSNDTGTPTASVSFSGDTVPGIACLALAPSALDFAQQEAGDAFSETKSVTVSNTGTVSLSVTPAVSFAAFTVNPSTPFTLAPGAAPRELLVTFDPRVQDSGALGGTLSLTSTPTSGCPSDIALSGTAKRTWLTVSPTTLPFGDAVVGGASPERQLTLQNPTDWPVTVFPVPSEPLRPYLLSGIPAGGLTVPAHSSALLTLTFVAATWGEAFERTLQLQSTATVPVSPVTLQGRALAPELVVTPLTLSFPSQPPGTETVSEVQLTNKGNQALFLSRITLDSGAHFELRDFLPQTLQPGASTPLKIAFRPTDVGTLETRARFFTTDDQPLPPTLLVKASATGPIPVFGVESIDFGQQQVEQLHANTQLTLRNLLQANDSLRVVSAKVLTSPSPFAVDAVPPSEVPIAPGEERKSPFRVTFAPSTVGRLSRDTLEVVFRGEQSSTTVTRRFPLSGQGADVQMTADLASVDFNETLPNTTTLKSLVLTNTGQVPINLRSVVTNPDTYFKASVDKWPDTLIPVNGTRRIDITFSPTRTGFESARLEIKLATDKDPAIPYLTRSLSGVGAFAKLELSTSLLTFGEVPRGTSSVQTMTLKNIGTATLTVSNVLAAGPFTAKPQTGSFPLTLVKNATALLDVTFRPETSQDALGTLHVLSNSDGSTDLPLNATGRGTVPVLVLPGGTRPSFAPQAQGIEGPSQPIVVKNEGKAPLAVYSITVPGDFCLYPEPRPATATCAPSLPGFNVLPGATASFHVAAKPSTRGPISRGLTLVSNAETSPTAVTLEVEGLGSVSLPSSAVSFGPVNFGAKAEVVMTVTNTGIAAAQVSLDFDAASRWRSEFSAPGLPLLVPPGGSAPLTLRFQPQGPEGGRRTLTATLTTSGTTAQAPLPLLLQGTATSARLEVAREDGAPFDAALDFGGTRVGAGSELIALRLTHLDLGAGSGTDAGTGAEAGRLTIQDLQLEGEDTKSFVLQKPALPAVLEPGGSTALTLQFRPDAQRRFNAALRITSDDSRGTSTVVMLGGQGRTSQLGLSALNLEFGARVAESSTSAIRSVRITNESLQSLKVTGLEIVGVAEQSEPSHFGLEPEPVLPLTLGPQEWRDLFVKYVPRPDVTSKAALELVTSDVESPVSRVMLSGRGLSTVFRALSRTVDFGTVRQSEAASTKVVLTNDSTRELVLLPPKVEGPQASHFTVVSPVIAAEGRALASGDSLTLELRYDTAQVATSKATLVLGTKEQERAALLSLSGVTVASFLSIEPQELDLGWVDIGATSEPRAITLTNQSASPARISLLENTNPAFEIDASALDAELPSGAQATLRVSFHPQEGGAATSTLRLRLRGETDAEAALTLRGQARTLGGEGGGCSCGTSGGGGAVLGLLLALGLHLGRGPRRRRA